MCGIFGIWNTDGKPADPLGVQRATYLLRHRGPDDEGYLLLNIENHSVVSCGGKDTDVRLNLPRIEKFIKGHFDSVIGHRRLAIIDLSIAGHQPMSNESGLIWIVYNGEIYNYREIRKELEILGHRFKSQTDTEVILHAYEEWGTNCLARFNGMWAFAIVDCRAKKVFCSRDRAGVKPFYYFYDGKRFCFASEIKALLHIEGFSIEPNEQILADYLFSGLIDHTHETFFKNICQLRPGEYLLLDGQQLTTHSYWDIEAKEIGFPKDIQYGERLRELLEDSIRLRLRSDVPIGSCLSGGLDSSSIVCVANKLMFDGKAIDTDLVGASQKTFSSCFENLLYDERKFIERVIKKTGAEKNYVFPQPEDLSKDSSKLIRYQEEPFGSTSIYAQWSVMRLVKERKVTVLLDGQGGDELLAGYIPSFYFLLGGFLKKGHLSRFINETKGFRNNYDIPFSKLWRNTLATIIFSWNRPWMRRFVKKGVWFYERGFRKRYLRIPTRPNKFQNDLDNYLYYAFRVTSLPALLHYEDRNSMAFSLETRLPFLDYRLVEYLFSLPIEQKIKFGETKVVLRNAMTGILPEEIRKRKDKMGFVTPEDIWFRTTLRNEIRGIIDSKSFCERGYFDVNKIKKAFVEHCDGKINMSATIWRWVNLELWFRAFIDKKPSWESQEDYGNQM